MLEHLWFSRLGVLPGIEWVGANDTAHHPTTPRTAPQRMTQPQCPVLRGNPKLLCADSFPFPLAHPRKNPELFPVVGILPFAPQNVVEFSVTVSPETIYFVYMVFGLSKISILQMFPCVCLLAHAVCEVCHPASG